MAFVHASPFVEWYRPLLDHLPELTTLHYQRRPPQQPAGGLAPLTINADAATCARLLDHLGWDRVHLVGHSFGQLLAAAATVDVIDAAVVDVATNGDEVLTSDPTDIAVLANAAGKSLTIIKVG